MSQTEAASQSAPAELPRLAGIPADRRRAIVVGASSGMGAAIVRQLAGEGYQVAALARRQDKLDELKASCEGLPGRVITRVHDVARVAEINGLHEALVRELGGLDLFVFAAGIMPEVEANEYDTQKDLDMLEINFVAWCNEVAKLFRTQRYGTLVGISSVAGDRGRKGNPMYGATKAAMNHYLEALRNRLSEVGVHEAAGDDRVVLFLAQEVVRTKQAGIDDFRRRVQPGQADADGYDHDDRCAGLVCCKHCCFRSLLKSGRMRQVPGACKD